MTPEELESAVLAGDVNRVVALLTAATEAERLACGPSMVKLRKTRGDWGYANGDGANFTSLLALYGTGTAAQIAAGRRMWRHDLAERLLGLRPDALLADLAPWMLDHFGWWPFVRSLVRRGRIPRPAGDAYIHGLLGGQVDADTLLRTDPELLGHEVWRLFEVEGTQDHSLADHDKYLPEAKGWQRALLVRSGRELDRDRLLDASLGALERDFPQFRAGWYSRFHEALSPTPDERTARVDAYLRLLRSPIGPTVALAVGALGEVQEAGSLDGSRLLANVGPAVTARAAGTARDALQLVDAAVRADPSLGRAAAGPATAALGHASPDVQRRAIALFATGLIPWDEEVTSALAARRGEVAASLRPRLDAMLAGAGAAATLPVGERPPAAARPAARPAVDPWATLEPMDPPGTLEALVEVIAAVLEREGPPEQLELALDGVLRFPRDGSRGFDRSTRSIRVRAAKLLKADRGAGIARWLAALVVAWVDGASPEEPPPDRGRLADALAGRVHEVALAAADGRRGRLLALPSFAGGWIEPVDLVARLAAPPRDGELSLDLPQALLRVLPIRREPALEAAATLDGEAGAAVRHALGGEAPIGPTAALWAAAARCRAPDGDDPDVDRAHPGLGPDAAVAGHYSFVIAQGRFMRVPSLDPRVPSAEPRLDIPTDLLWRVSAHAQVAGDDGPLVDWSRIIWPQDRRSWFAASAALMLWNLDWWEARWHDRRRLEPLFEPWTTIGPEAAALVAVVLQAKEPGQRGLAVDAAIALVGRDRLPSAAVVDAFDAIAAALEPQEPDGFTVTLFRPGRLATSLDEIGRRSEAHRAWALEVAAGALARMATTTRPEPVPVGQLTPMLRLLVELTAAIGMSVPVVARPSLERLAKGSGVGARLARDLVRGTPSGRMPPV